MNPTDDYFAEEAGSGVAAKGWPVVILAGLVAVVSAAVAHDASNDVEVRRVKAERLSTSLAELRRDTAALRDGVVSESEVRDLASKLAVLRRELLTQIEACRELPDTGAASHASADIAQNPASSVEPVRPDEVLVEK